MKTPSTLAKIVAMVLVLCMMVPLVASCDKIFGGSLKLEAFVVDRSTIKTSYYIGEEIDFSVCRAHVLNLVNAGVIDKQSAKLMLAATSENSLRMLPPPIRDRVRASIIKQMLLTMDTNR